MRRAAGKARQGCFKGWYEVKQRDDHALMQAVAKHGPVAVAVDAGAPRPAARPPAPSPTRRRVIEPGRTRP